MYRTSQFKITNVKKHIFDHFFLFFEIIVFAGTIKQFENDTFLIINFSLVLLLNLIKGRLTSIGISQVLLTFTALLVLPSIIWGIENLNIILGGYIRILTAILLVSYFRTTFLSYYENLIFILAVISLPLFFIQIMNIEIYNLFEGISNLLLRDERLNYGKEVLTGHRYLIVYNVNSWAEKRNSGFAWEPAGYGALLIWAIIINFFKYRFKFNYRLVIYIIAIFTTFSIGAYIALIPTLIYYFIQTKFKLSIFYATSLLVFTLMLYSTTFFLEMTDYMSYKASSNINRVQINDFSEPEDIKRNRAEGIIYGSKLLLISPIGYGLSPKELPLKFYSSNGFFNIATKYGLVGILLLILLINNIIRFLGVTSGRNSKHKYLIIMALIITINGNPFFHQPFFFAFLFSGFLNLKYIRNYNLNVFRAHRSLTRYKVTTAIDELH